MVGGWIGIPPDSAWSETPEQPRAATAIPDTAVHTNFRNGGSWTTSIDVNPATPAAEANATRSYVQTIRLLAVPTAAHLMQQAGLTQLPGRAGRECITYRMQSPGASEPGPEEKLYYWRLVRHVDVDDLDWTTTHSYILTERGNIGCITQTQGGKHRLESVVDLQRVPLVALTQLLQCLIYIWPGEIQGK